MKFNAAFNHDLVYRSLGAAFGEMTHLDLRGPYMKFALGQASKKDQKALLDSLPIEIGACLAYLNLLAAMYRDLNWLGDGERIMFLEEKGVFFAEHGGAVSLSDEIAVFEQKRHGKARALLRQESGA